MLGMACTVALVVAVIVGAVAWGRAYERDLDRRCEALGGRRVDIGVGEKLCFTEDWRWVKI